MFIFVVDINAFNIRVVYHRLRNCEADETQLVQPDLPRKHLSAATLGLWDSSEMEEGMFAPRELVELAIRDLRCTPKRQYVSRHSDDLT